MSIEEIIQTVTIEEVEATQVAVETHYESGVQDGHMIMIAFD